MSEYPWLIARTGGNRNDQAEKAHADLRRSGRRYHDDRCFGAGREERGARGSASRRQAHHLACFGSNRRGTGAIERTAEGAPRGRVPLRLWGRAPSRRILTHAAGRDGFWLARFLARQLAPELADGRTGSSNLRTTSSTTVASPGTSASAYRGKSCPSDQETGPTGHDQRNLVLGNNLPPGSCFAG